MQQYTPKYVLDLEKGGRRQRTVLVQHSVYRGGNVATGSSLYGLSIILMHLSSGWGTLFSSLSEYVLPVTVPASRVGHKAVCGAVYIQR